MVNIPVEIIVIQDDVIVKQQDNYSDGVLANPNIESNKQVSTLFRQKKYRDMIATWLEVRQKKIKRYSPRAIDDFLYNNGLYDDETFMKKLYEFIHR